MNRYYKIDHKFLFLFGYLFYFVTPYIVGVTNAFQGFPGIELYQSFFKRIPHEKLFAYAIISLSWLPCFYLGHFCFKLLKPYKRRLELFPATPTSNGVSSVGFLLIIVLLLFTYISRASLFGGYGSYDIGARGKMSTLLVVFNFFLIYQLVSKQVVSRLLIAGTIFTSLLLLTMGGRMYVIQTFLVFLIYKTSFAAKRFNGYQFIAFAFAGFILASFVGIWRIGTSFNYTMAVYSLFAEPVFTWFSTSSYLISNDIPFINMPLNFLTSFLNLVPNTLFSLQPYIVTTSQMAINYESPLGADSVWTNIVINFGSVGSCIFLFITGFLLNYLRHISEDSRFAAVFYIMICGMLPFQFFRDGFYIINKQLFINFLLLPGFIIILFKFIFYTTSPETQLKAQH